MRTDEKVEVRHDTDSCEVRSVDAAKVAMAKESLLEDEVYFELAQTFQAIGDPSRAKIVYSLLRQELCVCDLAAVVGLTDSAVSQHLRVLRNLRLVKTRREGKMVYYSLDDEHIRMLLNVCLDHIRH